MKSTTKLDFVPEGIIVSLSADMYSGKGYRHWLTNFLDAMDREDCTYWFRTSGQPKFEVLYLYILVAGRIRFRCNLAMTQPAGLKKFDDKEMFGRGWLVCCGPVVRPHPKQKDEFMRKGFQGFRYTEKLF